MVKSMGWSRGRRLLGQTGRLARDGIVGGLATACAVALRFDLGVEPQVFTQYLPYMAETMVAAVLAGLLNGTDRRPWRFASMDDVVAVLRTAMATVVIAAALAYVFDRLQTVHRAIPALQFLLIVGLMLAGRLAVRFWFRRRRRRLQFTAVEEVDGGTNALILGNSNLADVFIGIIERDGVALPEAARTQVRGILADRDSHVGRRVRHVTVLDVPENAATVVAELGLRGVRIARIIVIQPSSMLSATTKAVLQTLVRDHAIRIDWVSDHLLGADQGAPLPSWRGRAHAIQIGQDAVGSIVVHDTIASKMSWYWPLKRMIDIIGSVVIMTVTSPLLLIGMGLASIACGGTPFFWQERPGLGGLPVRVYKLRTMGPAYDDRGWRILDEHRLSKTGTLLRRMRIDELPQLWSVLTGAMSLIGPRPLLPIDQAPHLKARLTVRPGVTGWAQVCGGRDISPIDKAALDLYYIRNASPELDLKVAISTLRMIIFGERVRSDIVELAWRDLAEAGVFRQG